MAGGFFSGGSSDSVNASVAEAEAAAVRAEAAAQEVEDSLVIYDGQDGTENPVLNYTIPPADDDLATKFLNQAGDWLVPVGGSGAENLNELTDVTVSSPATDQFLQYNGTQWVNVAVDPADPLTAGTGLDITNNVVSIEDSGVGTNQLAANAVTSAKIVAGGVARTNIADNAINDSKLDATNTGTAGQILSATGTGNFTWVAADGNTAYTASEGLTLVGDDFQIASDGVTTVKIIDDAITSAKILDDNVTADELNVTGDGTSGQILSSDGDGSFTWIDEAAATTYTADENTLTLTGTVFSVETGGIDTAELADSAIETAKLNNLAVTGAKMANATITATQLADNAVTSDKITDLNVTTGKLADSAVTTVKLASSAVTSAKINNGAVTADELDVTGDGTNGQFLASDGDGSFTWTTASGGTQYTADGTTLALSDTNEFSIANDGVDTAQLADDSITAAQVTDGIITAGKLAVTGDGTDGQVLTSDGDGTFTWTTAGNSTTLAGLTDTNIPDGITNRRFLEYSPSDDRWDAVAITDLLNLHELFDVTLSSPTDNQFLRYDTNSAKWVNESVSIPGAVAAGTGISVSGSTVSIADDGVTGAKLADDAVTAAKIADNSITNDLMADDAIGTAELADTSVTNVKIANATITAAKVANNTLTASQLATDSVTSFKIQDGAVISGKIATNVVGADELNVSGDGTSGQVLSSDGDGTFSWVANGSGGETYSAGTGLDLSDGNQFSISDQGVGTTQIANDAITGTQLAAGSVGTTELEANAVETAKINDSAVTNAKLGTGAVNTSKIFDGAVTEAKLGTGSVTNVKLGTNSVTTTKIADGNVTNAKVATDIPISKLMDVNTAGALNGQVLTYNGTNWLPMTPSGGGDTDNSRLGIALDVTSLNEGDPAETVSVTLSIVDGLTDETASGQSVTVTDPTGHTINVDGSGNNFTFSASGTNVGNYVIRASATFTISGNTSVHTSSATLRVIPTPADNINWYQWVTDTQPTSITSTGVVDNGVFSSPETGTWTRPSEDTDDSEMAYVALPTGTYTFHAGLLFATITDLGTISTDYTLYRLDDFAQVEVDESRIITITEA